MLLLLLFVSCSCLRFFVSLGRPVGRSAGQPGIPPVNRATAPVSRSTGQPGISSPSRPIGRSAGQPGIPPVNRATAPVSRSTGQPPRSAGQPGNRATGEGRGQPGSGQPVARSGRPVTAILSRKVKFYEVFCKRPSFTRSSGLLGFIELSPFSHQC